MTALDRRTGLSRRPQALLKMIGVEFPDHWRTFIPGDLGPDFMVNEIIQPQLEARLSVPLQQHDLVEFILELRLAVRSEPHHLVLIAVFPEAQILRNRRIEEAQRMREGD